LKQLKIGNLLTSPTVMPEVDEDLMEGVEEVALATTLAQSRNCQPNAGKERRSNASRPQRKKDATKQESKNKLKAAIEELTRVVTSESEGDFDTLRRAACHVSEVAADYPWEERGSNDNPVTEGSLRTLIREELATLQQPKEATKTWAAVAASNVVPNKAATMRTIPAEPAKIVPARHLREVVINTSGTSVDMQKRTSKEIVAAVNTASSMKGAVAARQLPSGSTVITFLGQESKDWHTENPAWAITAFGPTAEIRHRTYTVVAKRLRTEDVKEVSPKDMAKEMAEENRMKISRVKVKRVRDQNARYTTLLVDVNTVEHANQLCERGLVWEAQIYQCEPFSGDLRPLQCYKCWDFGHMAKWCKKEARCGRCAATAHEGGEENCPSNRGEVPKRCPVCGKGHTVWDRKCPEATKHWNTAREAYAHRPARFEIEGQGRVTRATQLERGGDGFLTVAGRKRKATTQPETPKEDTRKAGRPKNIARAGQRNGQTLLQFAGATPLSSQAESSQSQQEGQW
jgi:hypothetical protein